MAKNKYFVIIPVHNEQRHLAHVIKKVNLYSKNIIVVNDGSTDKTKMILQSMPFVKSINLTTNEGKGAAMRHGAKLAWRLKAQGIVFIDGDNQHDPSHIPSFFKNLKDKHHLVIGVRKLKTAVPIYRKIGNICLIALVRLLFNISLPDLLCGYRGMTKNGYRQVLWKSDDYGVETEMITLIGKKRIKFKTITVNTTYVDKYKGFSIRNGLIILCKLPLWKFGRFEGFYKKRSYSYKKLSSLFRYYYNTLRFLKFK